MNDSLFIRRRARARCSILGLCLMLVAPRYALAQGSEAAAPAAGDPTPSPTDRAPKGGAATPKAPPKAESESDSDDASAAGDADEAAAAEAQMAEEEKESAAKSQKPPPKGKGVIWGTVTDTKFNEAVVEAAVQVVGQKQKAFADLEGRYRLELLPGKYRLRTTFELHRPSGVEVVVKAGELTHIDFKLVPDEGAIEEVVVEEKADQASAEGQALERKRSSAVGDGVGRAEIAHTPDKNAAEAAQRVVGATIVDGRFVFVRGLGERYTNALLNGAPLPSTEPDRNTVPLDLFPSLVLDSLTITKQFLPDMPADFAGGSVRINTRDFPRQPLLQLSVTGAYNTETTGRKRPGYSGSSTDWLGFDGGRRSFPSGIPNTKLNAASSSVDERVRYGHRFNTPLITYMKATPPNFGATLVAGNSYKVGVDSKLGIITALSYGRSYQLTQLTQRQFRTDKLPDGSPALFVQQEYSGQRSVDTVRWGAFGSAALEIAHRHTITLIGLRSQSADDSTYELESPREGGIHSTHLQYVSRALNFAQLRGEHHFPKLSDLEIDWFASLATANRDQPDTRDVRYTRGDRDGVPGWTYLPDGSGQHQFLKQSDTTVNAGLDVLQPLVKAVEHETKVKFGTLITSRDRSFRGRRFQLTPGMTRGFLYNELSFCPGQAWSGGCPNYLFRPELIRADGLLLDEYTQGYDQYETGLDVYAAYGMVDAKLLPRLRAVGGVRPEITFQSFAAFDQFDRTAPQARSTTYKTNWLPAISLVYELTPKTNARFGASQTVARPQLRELSPALTSSSAGDYSVVGNPNLKITKITNLDVRVEYFPTLREVLAASVFYKHFQDPIEEIVTGSALLGFTNAPKADLIGLELEGRKNLHGLGEPLRDFSVLANLTLVQSTVTLGNRKALATNDNRPLALQSPYVVNLAVDYSNQAHGVDVRVLYNVFGPRITIVGSNSLPDTYEMPRHSLDLTASKKFAQHLELKLQAQNILAAPVVFGYRGQQGYLQDGPRYQSLGRQPQTRSYNQGVTLAATATYTY